MQECLDTDTVTTKSWSRAARCGDAADKRRVRSCGGGAQRPRPGSMGGALSSPAGATTSAPSASAPPLSPASTGPTDDTSGAAPVGPVRLTSQQTRRAATAKREIEVYYRDLHSAHQERLLRAERLQQRAVSQQEKLRLQRGAARRELEARARRKAGFCVEDFDFVRKIGQGSYGEVFLVRDKASGELFALKRMRKDGVLAGRCVGNVWLERFVLATCGGRDFVCKMVATFQDRGYLYFLCEYLPGGDLLSMLIRDDRLSEQTAKFYIAEIVVALNALHATGVIHRDCKPDNVIFGINGHVRLADFGLSKSLLHVPPPGVVAGGPVEPEPPPGHPNNFGGPPHRRRTETLSVVPPRPLEGVLTPAYLDHVRMGAGGRVHLPLPRRNAAWRAVAKLAVFSTVGTPNYIACEVVEQRGYAEPVDWWSVGCILYEMLVGFPPFWAEDVNATLAMILRAEDHLVFPHESGEDIPRTMSLAAEDLIRKLLVCDPARRLGTKRGLVEFREHPFFEGVDWDTLGIQTPPFEPRLASDTDTRYFDEEVTSQEVPPPGSVPLGSSPSGSGVGDPDGASLDGGPWGTERDEKYDQEFDDASFPSSSLSRVTLTAIGRDGSDKSSATSGTACGRQRGEQVSSVGVEGLTDEASVLAEDGDSRSASRKRPSKRSCRTNYYGRCQDPEFVGFTFISNAKPKRQRVTPGLHMSHASPPRGSADAPSGDASLFLTPATSDLCALPIGPVLEAVEVSGIESMPVNPSIHDSPSNPVSELPEVAGADGSPGSLPGLPHSHSLTPGMAREKRSRFAPAQTSTVVGPKAIAAAIASAGTSSAVVDAEQQQHPSGRQISTSSLPQGGPVLDGGSDAEDDMLFGGGSSSSSESSSAGFSGSDEYEHVEDDIPVEDPVRADSSSLEGTITSDGTESEDSTSLGEDGNPMVPASTLQVRDGLSHSGTSSAVALDENDEELETFVDDEQPCLGDAETMDEVSKDSADSADSYQREDLVRLFSAALNMPVDEELPGASMLAPPPGLSSPALSRPLTPSHSRQASVQLPNLTPGLGRLPSMSGHSRQPSLQPAVQMPAFTPVHILQTAAQPNAASGHSRQPSVQLPAFAPPSNNRQPSVQGPSALPNHVREPSLQVPNPAPDHKLQLSLQVPLAAPGHSRQASVQLTQSPLTSSPSIVTPPWTDRLDAGSLPSAHDVAGLQAGAPGGAFSRYPASRPTHAKRTDAGQQSLYNISAASSAKGDDRSLDERDFLNSGLLYSAPSAPNQALHALELAAALGEAAVTSSRQASPLPAQDAPPVPPGEIHALAPLTIQGVAPFTTSGHSSLSPVRRSSTGNHSMPLSPLAISVTPPSLSRAGSSVRSPLATEMPLNSESNLSQCPTPKSDAFSPSGPYNDECEPVTTTHSAEASKESSSSSSSVDAKRKL